MSWIYSPMIYLNWYTYFVIVKLWQGQLMEFDTFKKKKIENCVGNNNNILIFYFKINKYIKNNNNYLL